MQRFFLLALFHLFKCFLLGFLFHNFCSNSWFLSFFCFFLFFLQNLLNVNLVCIYNLLSWLNIFFFLFSCCLTNCIIQSFVVSMYLSKPIVVVLYDNFSWIRPLPSSLRGMYKRSVHLWMMLVMLRKKLSRFSLISFWVQFKMLTLYWTTGMARLLVAIILFWEFNSLLDISRTFL